MLRMAGQQLDYATPYPDVARRPLAICVTVIVFVAIVAAIEFVLVRTGQDDSPGSWADVIVLAYLSPAANVIAGVVFIACSLWFTRRIGGSLLLYFTVAVLVPLVGAMIVYRLVSHH
jgi:hypothetical protein